MSCNLQVVALRPGLCRDTRHFPGQDSHHLSRPHSKAGLACSTRNAGLGARRPGHIPGETPGLGGKFAQLCAQLRLGAGEGIHTNSLSSSSLLGADWLAENPGGWWCASHSPGPETQRAGKGCLRGTERREREGR